MKVRASLLLAVFFIFFVSFGCKSWVQAPNTSSLLTDVSVFSDAQTATSAQLYLYINTSMQTESWNMSQNCGLLADELNRTFSQSSLLLQYYTNTMAAKNAPGSWGNAYNYIYQCNAIIERLSNNIKINSTVRNQLTGESEFLRAYWYFYLTNCYGAVPLVLTTDYTINSRLGRSSTEQVYSQIVSDLEQSKNLLNGDYVDATDSVVTTERVRPTKWAAYAMLARVFLYTKKYDSALKYSDLLLKNSSMYSLVASLDDVFKMNSTEAIWQLQVPVPANRNTIDGNNFILKSKPGTGGNNAVTISDNLLGGFEEGDLRKTHWIGAITVSGNTYLFPFKYKAYRTSNVTEYTMMLRLAEQYLIRSEARVYLADFDGAISDIDAIRVRAGLDKYSGLKDRSSILSEIMQQRRFEFFAEWGHRWFDLIRTSSVNTVMSSITPTKGGTWFPEYALFPLPQSEIDTDPFLYQNPGY